MIRKDISHLASELAAKSGFSQGLVECYLFNVGKLTGKNPCRFKWDAVSGFVFMVGDPDNFCLGERPRPNIFINEKADYWENRILAKQEAWMD